ncbi:hypothetical protein HYH03_011907 [Edaphochlamys debaryana]|uniref:Ricin B lectin domain-containing protein n=1 Tax=Edaphochlamys debaryana TaxID=47281 RepID=A0A836BW08_9CHLO|nr:hypothetical protein HYH03_011907 [Edaphochlamys debaryana]|eukprot:KAG2489628.1 hypothetical protein HYH03_011907 [Edaphochlamys debaryana]
MTPSSPPPSPQAHLSAGEYALRSNLPGAVNMCVDLHYEDAVNGSLLEHKSCSPGQVSQVWVFEPLSSGYLRVRSAKNASLCWGTYTPSPRSWTVVGLAPCVEGLAEQEWRAYPDGVGGALAFALRAAPGLCLDATHGYTWSGATMAVTPCGGKAFTPVDPGVLQRTPSPPQAPVLLGQYAFYSTIPGAVNLCLDGAPNSGSNLEQRSCGLQTSVWELEPLDGGHVRARSTVNATWCWAVKQNRSREWNAVGMAECVDGEPSQEFYTYPNGDDGGWSFSPRMAPYMCLDIINSYNWSGATVVLRPCTQQAWVPVSPDAISRTPSPPRVPALSGAYSFHRLLLGGSHLCLGIGSPPVSGQHLQQQTCGGTEQVFMPEATGGGYYRFRGASPASGSMCWATEGGGDREQTRVVVYPCSLEDEGQQFYVYPVGEGWAFTPRNAPYQCLTVINDYKDPGWFLMLWPCRDQSFQAVSVELPESPALPSSPPLSPPLSPPPSPTSFKPPADRSYRVRVPTPTSAPQCVEIDELTNPNGYTGSDLVSRPCIVERPWQVFWFQTQKSQEHGDVVTVRPNVDQSLCWTQPYLEQGGVDVPADVQRALVLQTCAEDAVSRALQSFQYRPTGSEGDGWVLVHIDSRKCVALQPPGWGGNGNFLALLDCPEGPQDPPALTLIPADTYYAAPPPSGYYENLYRVRVPSPLAERQCLEIQDPANPEGLDNSTIVPRNCSEERPGQVFWFQSRYMVKVRPFVDFSLCWAAQPTVPASGSDPATFPDGLAVLLAPCKERDAMQLFKWRSDKLGGYLLVHILSGKCVQPPLANSLGGSGNTLSLWHCPEEPQYPPALTLVTAEAPTGKPPARSPPAMPTAPPPLVPPAPTSDGGAPHVVFRAWMPHVCVGPQGGVAREGAVLAQGLCDGSFAQAFAPEPLEVDGFYRFHSAADRGLCWSWVGPGITGGAPSLALRACSATAGALQQQQQFEVVSLDQKSWNIRVRVALGGQPLCVGLQREGEGRALQLGPCDGTWAQQFSIVPAGPPPGLVPDVACFDALSGMTLEMREGSAPPPFESDQPFPPQGPTWPAFPPDTPNTDGMPFAPGTPFPPDLPPPTGDEEGFAPPPGEGDTNVYFIPTVWADSVQPDQAVRFSDGCLYDTSADGGYGSILMDGMRCFASAPSLAKWNTSAESAFTVVVIYKLDPGAGDYALVHLSRSPWDYDDELLLGRGETFLHHRGVLALNNTGPQHPAGCWVMDAYVRQEGGTEGALYGSRFGQMGLDLVEEWTGQTPIPVGSDSLILGADWRDEDKYLKGRLAVVLIYSRVLDQEDLGMLYDSYAPRFGYWEEGPDAAAPPPEDDAPSTPDAPPPPVLPALPPPGQPAQPPPTYPPRAPYPPQPPFVWPCNGTGLVRGPFGTRPGGAPFNDSAASGGGRLPISRIAWSAGYSLAGLQLSYGIFAAPLRGGNTGFASGAKDFEKGDRIVWPNTSVALTDISGTATDSSVDSLTFYWEEVPEVVHTS